MNRGRSPASPKRRFRLDGALEIYRSRREFALSRTARGRRRIEDIGAEWRHSLSPFSQFRAARSMAPEDARPSRATPAIIGFVRGFAKQRSYQGRF